MIVKRKTIDDEDADDEHDDAFELSYIIENIPLLII